MEEHNLIGDTKTNKRGAEPCDTEDCLNNYTPYCIDHEYYCVTCAHNMGIDVTA